tara:strand:- start:82 stop:510 length:429 start_codon:yes stop_codon:yes gene_type:complete
MYLRGYVSSRNFFEYNPPQKIQNLTIRDYCSSNNFKYLLSATEYSMKNSYLILEEFLKFRDDSDGLAFYSLFQLPVDFDIRTNIFKRALKKSKQLHFALENLVLKKSSDITIINNLFHIKLAYQKCLSLENIKKNIDLHTKN